MLRNNYSKAIVLEYTVISYLRMATNMAGKKKLIEMTKDCPKRTKDLRTLRASVRDSI